MAGSTPLRFWVSSGAAAAVVLVALVPGLALLLLALRELASGRIALGAGSVAGFLAVMLGAQHVSLRIGRWIEVTDDEVRAITRAGEVTAIRWDEPHTLEVNRQTVSRAAIPLAGTARVVVTAGDRRIAFSTTVRAGMAKVAAAMPLGKDLAFPDAAIARMIERSAAAQARRG